RRSHCRRRPSWRTKADLVLWQPLGRCPSSEIFTRGGGFPPAVRILAWSKPTMRETAAVLSRRTLGGLCLMKPVRLAAALTIAAVLLLPIVASAQQKKPQGEPERLVETMDVRVINIDVVVTDKKGNPVRGLKKSDFEIIENGTVKPLSNFYEVAGSKAVSTDETPVETTPGAAPAPAAQTPVQVDEDAMRRRIIFYIDNLSLAPFNRNRVFTQMKDFVKTAMRPGDEAMIATFNRSMKVRVPFTRDPVQLIQTLDIIAGESAMGPQNKSERKDVEDQIRQSDSYDDAIAAARTYAQSQEHDLRQSVESLNALMSTLAGVEGKKILVLTSEGFPD